MNAKHTLRRITSLFIALLCTASMLCIPVSAYGGQLYNSDLSWNLDDNTGILTISGVGPMPDYTSGDLPPYCGNVNGRYTGPLAKTFVVSEGVTRVGNYALNAGNAHGTINVRKAYVASTVTSIGDYSLHTAEVIIYSENCSFGSYPFSTNTTIYCYTGSTAHSYAIANGIHFVLMCREHTPETRDAVEPTCLEAGYSGDVYCAVCEMLLEEGSTVPALGHDYQITNAVAPTCLESGYSGDSVCTRCSEVKETGEVLSPLGHDWSPWSLVLAPTCTVPGYSLRICNRCSATEKTVVEALGHSWDENSTIVVEPTCTTSGSIQRTCIICHETVTTEIEPLGHEYDNDFCIRCGEIDPSLGNPFEDVKTDKYYYKPVLWAYYHDPQITGGTDATHFSPKKTCTREQIVTFLWKAAGAPEPETTESPFSDVKPEKYYFKPIMWAVENGITGGVGDSKFGVKQGCTRAQCVTFLWKAAGAPEPKTTTNPFSDVKPGKYYFKAIIWAVENGITGGVGDGKFGVSQTCTRGQIVTFLYKYMVG